MWYASCYIDEKNRECVRGTKMMPPLANDVIKGHNSKNNVTQIYSWSELSGNKHCVNLS